MMLTDLEMERLYMVETGKTDAEIAAVYDVKEKTIRRALGKLTDELLGDGRHTRDDLIAFCKEQLFKE